MHTERQAVAEQGHGTGCPAPCGTPQHTAAGRDGTGLWGWGFVDVISINTASPS